MGEINKGAVAFILLALVGAGGYLWYSMLYQPAVTARVTALQSADAADQTLQQAEQKLVAAQQQLQDAKKASAAPDDSVARVAKSRTAVPDKALLDDATIVLMELADRSGISTNIDAGTDQNAGAAVATGNPGGAVPIDLTFEAAGTYAEMMQFMSLVESTVEEKDDKLYSRGRLFNVVKLEIGAKEDSDSSGGGFGADGSGSESGGDPGGLVVGPNDMLFTVVVRMYTSTTENAEGLGAATPDPAAAATTTTPGAADAGAAGGTGGAPGATGDGTSGSPAITDGAVDPGATGATPAMTGAGGI